MNTARSIFCEGQVVIKYGETPVNIEFSEEKDGAGHGVRTRDIQLGKLALYQLS